jgi:hypothetical protein
MQDSFLKACMYGKLIVAQELFTNNKINIHTNNDEVFRSTCSQGHINIAQWLYRLDDKPNIHAEDEFAFRFVCYNGHINIAQWLYGLEDKPNIHAIDD